MAKKRYPPVESFIKRAQLQVGVRNDERCRAVWYLYHVTCAAQLAGDLIYSQPETGTV
jgi:hypothetical protein